MKEPVISIGVRSPAAVNKTSNNNVLESELHRSSTLTIHQDAGNKKTNFLLQYREEKTKQQTTPTTPSNNNNTTTRSNPDQQTEQKETR